MKQLISILLFVLFAFSIADAQTAEIISELTPVPSNIGKFTKHVPKPQYETRYAEKIKFDVKIDPINLPNGKKAIAITIRITTDELWFENIGGIETARVKFYGRITSKDRQTDGFFEERQDFTMKIEELADGTVKPVVLRRVFDLPEGKYQIGVIVRDIFSGGQRVKIIKFLIP